MIVPTALKDLELSFTLPDDSDGISETFHDPMKAAEVITKSKGDPDAWRQVLAHIAKASADKDKGAQAEQLAELLELKAHELANMPGMSMVGNPDLNASKVERFMRGQIPAAPRSQFYCDEAPGAAVDKAGLFTHAGQAIQAIYAMEQPVKARGLSNFEDLRAKALRIEEVQAAYSSHIGPSGGYLMPESFRTQMLQIAHERAVVRANGPTVIPMSTPKVSIPAIHETNRSASLFGGVQIYWTAEEADSTESEAQFKVVTLEPDTMTGYAEIPNETLMDSLASGAYFNATFPAAMAFEEDYAFLQGPGEGQPLGIFNGGAMLEVTHEGDTSTGITYEDVVNMWARCLPTSMPRAVWIANQETIPELMKMGLVIGTGGTAMFNQSIVPGMPMSMLGRPLIFTEKANGLNTRCDLSLVDMSFYLIGDLQTMTVSTSNDYKFKERRTAFSLVSRVDGQPWLETPITPRHGTNTLSPFVTIGTRS